MANTNGMQQWDAVQTMSFSKGTQSYKLVSWQGGEWEVYRVEQSGESRGLEMFLGYANKVLPEVARGGL